MSVAFPAKVISSVPTGSEVVWNMGATFYSSFPYDLEGRTLVGLEASWRNGGTDTTGSLSVEVSNSSGSWTTVDFSPAISGISGSSGARFAQITDCAYRYVRVKYTRTSGSGSLDCWIGSKQG